MLNQMKMPRDYRISGGLDKVVALDDDKLEERVEGTWWSPAIPRKELRALMVRTDSAALAHFAVWFLLLAVSAPLAWLSWGTWWAIPAFLVYGTIYSSSDARWHECGHGTPFRTRWLNEICYHVSSFMTIREGFLWRWSHARHHTSTIMVGLDPEIQVKRPADLLKILADFFYIFSGPPEVWRVIRHAFGEPNEEVKNFVPVEERWKMVWSSRVYVAIWAGFALWSLAIGSFLPMMFVALPRFYAGWLHQLLGLTQHAGLAEDTFDHRECTRTVYINPVFRYLYMNMNYHVEHHALPMVPYHALPQLHAAVLEQMPTPYPNLWAVYKELIPTLIKQATGNPDYTIVRDLPAPKNKPEAAPVVALPPAATLQMMPAIQAVSTVLDPAPTAAQTVSECWVEACAVDDLEEEEVRSFQHNGKTYAIYRLLDDDFYASDALCTHEKVDLSNGLVINGCIECPMHNGRFNIASGKAVTPPVFEDLKTYQAERRGDAIFINIAE